MIFIHIHTYLYIHYIQRVVILCYDQKEYIVICMFKFQSGKLFFPVVQISKYLCKRGIYNNTYI